MIRGLSGRIRPYLPIPEKPTVGYVFGSMAFSGTILLLLWYFVPQSVLVWSKTSLIGFTIINLCRLLISILLPYVFFTSRYAIPDSEITGSNPGFGAVLHSLLAGLPAMLLFVAVHNLTARFMILRSVPVPQPAVFFTTRDASLQSTVLLVLIGGILPILMEEFFFRGLLTAILPASLYNRKGYVWIAFLFAVYALNPVDFAAVLMLGLLLGYIRYAFDNLFCCILTRLSMLGSYLVFRSLLPYMDTSVVRTEADIDSTVLYTAVTALIMGILILVPILSQIRRISGDLKLERIDEEPKEDGRLRDHIGWTYWLGMLFFAGLWALTLRI